ncbi:MAG: DUF4404 family protein [Limisphaerales bacterium]
MIQDTIQKIEARLQSAENLGAEARGELTELLAELKTEVSEISDSHADQAQSIAGFADLSTHEAVREGTNQKALDHSLGGLQSSVEELEQSHPGLVSVVNRICTALSNLGI